MELEHLAVTPSRQGEGRLSMDTSLSTLRAAMFSKGTPGQVRPATSTPLRDATNRMAATSTPKAGSKALGTRTASASLHPRTARARTSRPPPPSPPRRKGASPSRIAVAPMMARQGARVDVRAVPAARATASPSRSPQLLQVRPELREAVFEEHAARAVQPTTTVPCGPIAVSTPVQQSQTPESSRRFRKSPPIGYKLADQQTSSYLLRRHSKDALSSSAASRRPALSGAIVEEEDEGEGGSSGAPSPSNSITTRASRAEALNRSAASNSSRYSRRATMDETQPFPSRGVPAAQAALPRGDQQLLADIHEMEANIKTAFGTTRKKLDDLKKELAEDWISAHDTHTAPSANASSSTTAVAAPASSVAAPAARPARSRQRASMRPTASRPAEADESASSAPWVQLSMTALPAAPVTQHTGRRPSPPPAREARQRSRTLASSSGRAARPPSARANLEREKRFLAVTRLFDHEMTTARARARPQQPASRVRQDHFARRRHTMVDTRPGQSATVATTENLQNIFKTWSRHHQVQQREATRAPKRISIYLGRNIGSLGVKIVGCKQQGADAGIFVDYSDDVAASKTLLKRGDRIIEINGVSLKDKGNNEARDALKQAVQSDSAVTVGVLRYAEPAGGQHQRRNTVTAATNPQQAAAFRKRSMSTAAARRSRAMSQIGPIEWV